MEILNTTPTHPDANSYATIEEADAYFDNRNGVENWGKLNSDTKSAVLQLATKHIDSLRFRHEKIFECPQYFRREQMLAFPRCNASSSTGVVESADATSFTSPSLANRSIFPDKYFDAGYVVISDGTGKGQTYKVSSFEMLTGKVTVTEAWAVQPDTTSRFLIGERIPNNVKYAVFEQALYILNGGGERQRLQAEGVVEYSIGDLTEKFSSGVNNGKIPVCNEAKGYLRGLWTNIGVML